MKINISAPSDLSHPRLSVMDFLNSIKLKYPSAISFGSGRPADEFCEPDRFSEWVSRFEGSLPSTTTREVLLGQYGRTNGIIGDHLAAMLIKDEKIQVKPEDVIVTAGGQEAMLLPLLAFFDRKTDVLLATDPTFVGITGAAMLLGIDVEPVLLSDSGYRIEAFETAIQNVLTRGKTPKAIYVIPDFDNPLGFCMPLDIRHKLLLLAQKYNVMIFEDNPYGVFRYEGEKIPMLKALDEARSVIYMGSFAKTLFPGLRGGFLVADQEVIMSDGSVEKAATLLAKARSFVTVNVSPIIQAAIAGALIECDFSLLEANEKKISVYRERRDCMLRCLEEAFPSEWGDLVKWNRPAGGFFLTVRLPFEMSEERLTVCAKEYGVIVVPLRYFAISPGFQCQVRLAFSNNTPDKIVEGLKRFSLFVKETYRKLLEQHDEKEGDRQSEMKDEACQRLSGESRAPSLCQPLIISQFFTGKAIFASTVMQPQGAGLQGKVI